MGGKWARKKSAHNIFLKKMGNKKNKKTWADHGRRAHYFRMKIPESKFTLNRSYAIPKISVKIFCSADLKKKMKKWVFIKKKTWAAHGLRAHEKKRKTWACKKKNLGKSPFFFTSILGAHVSAFPTP